MSARRVLVVVALLGAACSLVQAIYAAWWMDRTWDEPAHLAYAERLLHDGETERQSRPDFDSKTPILVPHVALAGTFGARVEQLPAPRALFLFRLPTVLALALLYVSVALAGRALGGLELGLLALTLAAADPNLVAHGALATVDAIFALATLLALLAALRFWRGPTLTWALVAGAALGLCLVAKFSATLMVALCLIGPPLCGVRPADARGRPAPLTVVFLLLVAAASAWLVIAAAYGFAGIGLPVLRHPYQTGAVGGLVRALPRLASLLPRDFWSGIDICLAEDLTTDWNVVVLGRHFPRGVWWYFPLVWACKTPLLLAAALLLGVATYVARPAMREPRTRTLLLALVVLLAWFSFAFHTQKGLRYVLMCLPLAYLVAARGLLALGIARAAALGALVTLAAMIGRVPTFADPLAYTSALVRPKKDVYRYVTDSNIEWMQTDRHVAAWADAHPHTVVDPPHLGPGRNLVSVNRWAGVVGRAAADPRGYLPARGARTPDDHLFFTYLVFDVAADEAERILDAYRRVPPSACPPLGQDSEALGAGDERTVTRGESLCVDAEGGGADISLRTLAHEAAVFVPGQAGAVPFHDELGQRAKAWYRLAGAPAALHTSGGPLVVRVERGAARLRHGPPTVVPIDGGLSCAGGRELLGDDGRPLPLFVRGSFAAWQAWSFTRLRFEGGCYRVRLELPAGETRFKIAGDDWQAGAGRSIYGSAAELVVDRAGALQLERVGAPSPDARLRLASAGRYEVALRLEEAGGTVLVRAAP